MVTKRWIDLQLDFSEWLWPPGGHPGGHFVLSVFLTVRYSNALLWMDGNVFFFFAGPWREELSHLLLHVRGNDCGRKEETGAEQSRRLHISDHSESLCTTAGAHAHRLPPFNHRVISLQGHCTQCDGRDDMKEYSNICSAMKVLEEKQLECREKIEGVVGQKLHVWISVKLKVVFASIINEYSHWQLIAWSVDCWWIINGRISASVTYIWQKCYL